MFNFKKSEGTFKGLAGEVMFRISNKNAILTHFIPKKRILPKVMDLTKNQIDFLNLNWHSIDAIDISRKIIYEIKTKNDNIDLNKYPIKLTNYQTILFKNAKKQGFVVKICIVWLHKNWNYSLQEVDFEYLSFYQETPLKFDKEKYSKK